MGTHELDQKKYKLPDIEAIQYNSWSCLEFKDFWQALHLSIHVITILFGISSNKSKLIWWIWAKCMPFSKEEFKIIILKYNNLSLPGPNKLLWRYLKVIINDCSYLKKFINIANICINLEYWPSHFKISNSIIIPKPNKYYKISYSLVVIFELISISEI